LTGFDKAANEINAITHGAGLEHGAVMGYVPIDDRKNLEVVLAGTAALGARQVRVTMPKALTGIGNRELFARCRADVAYVADRAKAHGVRALIQIHHGNVVSTASAGLRLLDGLDPQSIGVIHDFGNMTIEGREGLLSWTLSLEIIRDYLAHVHIKNALWKPSATRPDGTVEWAWSWASLRAGLGDVPSYFKALHEVGYDGWVGIENFTTDLPLAERLADDLGYLKNSARAAGYAI
jgi:sugar phosphate isomerase/epimerase